MTVELTRSQKRVTMRLQGSTAMSSCDPFSAWCHLMLVLVLVLVLLLVVVAQMVAPMTAALVAVVVAAVAVVVAVA